MAIFVPLQMRAQLDKLPGLAREVVEHSKSGLSLNQLHALAIKMINKHIDNDGACADCNSKWPCNHAVLAEHNLALLSGP